MRINFTRTVVLCVHGTVNFASLFPNMIQILTLLNMKYNYKRTYLLPVTLYTKDTNFTQIDLAAENEGERSRKYRM